jgi:hypothetical protein
MRTFIGCSLAIVAIGVGAQRAALSTGLAEVRGYVVSEGHGVAQAQVRLHGGDQSTTTDDKGAFVLRGIATVGSHYVIAAKPGYYNARQLLAPGTTSLQLTLLRIPDNDHHEYEWVDPTPAPERDGSCGNCHSRIYSEWADDAHARASTNPVVLSMYQGTHVDGRTKVAPGYRLDWSDTGTCSTCHAPLSRVTSGTDLGAIEGVARTGVSCDFCHKVMDVVTTAPFSHVSDMRVVRPPPGQKLIFGPLEDAMFKGDVPDLSVAPVFKSSRFCAGCHDGSFWGTPVYETYTEWRNSPYATAGVQCQQCHMAPNGHTRIVDEAHGGITRAPDRVSSHRMMGDASRPVLANAVRSELTATRRGPTIVVDAAVTNTGAGHHVPTGQPMRNMLLVLDALDADGRRLRLISGERVPVWGGDYSGAAGMGFAKILSTLSEYAREPQSTWEGSTGANFPAPFWRRNKILSDSRLAAKARVQRTYVFDAGDARLPITINSRVIYRRAFQQLARLKGWPMNDTLLDQRSVTVAVESAGER